MNILKDNHEYSFRIFRIGMKIQMDIQYKHTQALLPKGQKAGILLWG